MTKIIEINDNNFDSSIKEYSNLLVDFHATWCGPCKMISPILDEISNDQSLKTKIAKVNIDEAPLFTQKMKVRSVPSIFYFKNGQPIDKFLVAPSKNNIINFIKNNE
jgi:thioredoxin 1